MKALTPHEMLEVWERGSRLHPLDQGLLVLCAALPEGESATVADWTLGRRNRALLELHSECFGSQLRGWIACTNCGEKMEFDVDARLLLNATDESRNNETLLVNDRAFRLPTSRDLAEAASEGDPERAALRLVERCHLGEELVSWTEEDLDVIGERFAMAEPMAEPRLALVCPSCDETHEETLDPVTFLWSELQSAARRIVLEIHTLASEYGWSEREILGLSDVRRSLYLQMVRA